MVVAKVLPIAEVTEDSFTMDVKDVANVVRLDVMVDVSVNWEEKDKAV